MRGFCPLASGSKGNCIFLGTGKTKILIDAGIGPKLLTKRLDEIDVDLSEIEAILITHEHSDHIRGVEGLSKKHNLPVYITEATLKQSRLGINRSLSRVFSPYEAVSIGNLSIVAFPKLHDAIDPHSFLIEGNGITIGVLTDIGHAC